jgi:hypothetical protein
MRKNRNRKGLVMSTQIFGKGNSSSRSVWLRQSLANEKE